MTQDVPCEVSKKKVIGLLHYITLNGCQVRCASKALESINLKPDQEIVVTHDLNLQKNKNYDDNQGLDELAAKIDNLISAI